MTFPKKINSEHLDRKKMFWFLTVNMVAFLSLYVYFVSDTTYSIILRQRTEKTISGLENNITKLETDYFVKRNAVTADLARAKGFEEITSTKFVSRDGNVKSLSLNSNI